MGRLGGSFLLRCWRLGAGEERYEVEHIQSGERTVAASPAAAWAWIVARVAAAERGPPIHEPGLDRRSAGEAPPGGPAEEPPR
jgi:hypothetical protein